MVAELPRITGRPWEVTWWIKLILHLVQELFSDTGKSLTFCAIHPFPSLRCTTTELRILEVTFLLVYLIHIIWNFTLMKPSAILNLLWWKVLKVYHPLCKVLLNYSNWFEYHPESPGVCIVGIGEPWIYILLTITCMICLVMPSLSLLCSKLSSPNF